MIVFKNDILKKLAAVGYTTYKLRTDKVLSNTTLTNIRNNKPVDTTTIDKICTILQCQPNDIMEWKQTTV